MRRRPDGSSGTYFNAAKCQDGAFVASILSANTFWVFTVRLSSSLLKWMADNTKKNIVEGVTIDGRIG
jgi:hypothetical protein